MVAEMVQMLERGARRALQKRIRDATSMFHRFWIDFGSHFGDMLMVLACFFDLFLRQCRRRLPISCFSSLCFKWPESFGSLLGPVGSILHPFADLWLPSMAFGVRLVVLWSILVPCWLHFGPAGSLWLHFRRSGSNFIVSLRLKESLGLQEPPGDSRTSRMLQVSPGC